MVKISYVEITARGDYPIVGRSARALELHLWEPTLQTLARQTMKDFEYVVVDVFYDERPEYFKEHNYGLKIKHVPAKPNVWSELGMVQACHQLNLGLIHSDGELVFMSSDNNMYPPDFMMKVWNCYKEGFFVSAGFGIDVSCAGEEAGELVNMARVNTVPTGWYEFLGFNGLTHMDQRYNRLFEGNLRKMSYITPHWYYGIGSVSLEAALKVNGFNEFFDGDVADGSDVDFGYRLLWAGYDKLAMYRDIYVVEAYSKGWHPKMRGRMEFKCNYALLKYNQEKRRILANKPLSSQEVEWIMKNVCGDICEVREECVRKCPYRAPFYNKMEMELYLRWLSESAPYKVDLELEREMRIDGEEYLEGTFT